MTDRPRPVRIAFDFDDAARRHAIVTACSDAMLCELVSADLAPVVVVGESRKCDAYLKAKKTVVYCPVDKDHEHVRVVGRNAALDRGRLFVVGSKKAPGLFDAIANAVIATE